MHTHVHRSVTSASPDAGQALEAMAAYFKTDAAAYPVDELAQYYRDRNMAGHDAASSRLTAAAPAMAWPGSGDCGMRLNSVQPAAA